MKMFSCTGEEFEIEFISFSYKYKELINLLERRGNAIRRAKSVECFRKLDKLIDDHKKKLLENDNCPVSAFVTFKDVKGFRFALDKLGSEKCYFRGWVNKKEV